jgi:hypothetical protein
MSSSSTTVTTGGEASHEELAQQEFIYHADQVDPNGGDAVEKGEELSRTAILMDVVKSLRTGKDLYRISLPAALLRPMSMLEYIALFVNPQQCVLDIASNDDPEQRLLAIVKWWVSNMTRVPQKGIMGCKPYNAILGEVFTCKFIHNDSKSYLIAEQVSHHPPISACYMTNRKKNLAVKTTLKPKSKFHGNSASTILDGEIVIQLLNLKEQYVISFPHVVATGLIWGSQGLEVNDYMKVKCSKTGLQAKIEFRSKSDNEVRGSIKRGNDRLYKLSGSITDKVMIKNLRTDNVSTFIDATSVQYSAQYVTPVVKQDKHESRRVWHKVSYCLKKAKYTDANVYKTSVEDEQRSVRKKKEESAEQHKPKYFNQEGESWRCIFENVKEYAGVDEPELEASIDLFAVTDDERAFINKHVPDHHNQSS